MVTKGDVKLPLQEPPLLTHLFERALLRANPSKDGDAELRGYGELIAMPAGPPAIRPHVEGRRPVSFVRPLHRAAKSKAVERANASTEAEPNMLLPTRLLLRDLLPKGTPWWAVLITRVATLLAWGLAVALALRGCGSP